MEHDLCRLRSYRQKSSVLRCGRRRLLAYFILSTFFLLYIVKHERHSCDWMWICLWPRPIHTNKRNGYMAHGCILIHTSILYIAYKYHTNTIMYISNVPLYTNSIRGPRRHHVFICIVYYICVYFIGIIINKNSQEPLLP